MDKETPMYNWYVFWTLARIKQSEVLKNAENYRLLKKKDQNEKVNFDPHLKKRWLNMNIRMNQIGVGGFYKETKDKPRYI